MKNVSNMVVATYTKITVARDYERRKAIRGSGEKYKVFKNTKKLNEKEDYAES